MPDADPDTPASVSLGRRGIARVEALSGSMIEITLLVLQIHVPAEATGDAALARALGAAWPSLLAYLTSFSVIGVIWLNHHRTFQVVRQTDGGLLGLNLALLLGVGFIPFPTELFATYLAGACCWRRARRGGRGAGWRGGRRA